MLRLLLLVYLTACGAASAPAWAQTDIDAAIAQAGKSRGEIAESDAANRGATALPASPDPVVLSDPETKQKYLASLQRYYDYRSAGYAHRSAVFEWQLLSSRITFVVVLAVVGLGLYFAAVQFRVAMSAARFRPRPEGGPAESGPAEAPSTPFILATQIEMSAKGMTVNSSVLGVVILALSLGFFYLYLVYVYPISDAL